MSVWELSAKTAGYSSTPHLLGTKPLWGKPGFKLPDYIENVAKGLIEDGHDRSSAIAIAISAVKRWATGGGKVGPEVRAASAKAVAEWTALKASAGGSSSHSAVRTGAVELVGPKGYVHGWIKVGDEVADVDGAAKKVVRIIDQSTVELQGKGGKPERHAVKDIHKLDLHPKPQVTPAQYKALHSYTHDFDLTDHTGLINQQLREGADADDPDAARIGQHADALRALAESTKLDRDVTVWRGLPSDSVSSTKPGAILTDHGFVSTSKTDSAASQYGDVTMEIHAPKGSSALDMASVGAGDLQHEVLFPPGSKFKIRQSSMRAGRRHLVVDLVSEKPESAPATAGPSTGALRNRFKWMPDATLKQMMQASGTPPNVKEVLRELLRERGETMLVRPSDRCIVFSVPTETTKKTVGSLTNRRQRNTPLERVDLAGGQRVVASPAGVIRFKAPIGTPIVAGQAQTGTVRSSPTKPGASAGATTNTAAPSDPAALVGRLRGISSQQLQQIHKVAQTLDQSNPAVAQATAAIAQQMSARGLDGPDQSTLDPGQKAGSPWQLNAEAHKAALQKQAQQDADKAKLVAQKAAAKLALSKQKAAQKLAVARQKAATAAAKKAAAKAKAAKKPAAKKAAAKKAPAKKPAAKGNDWATNQGWVNKLNTTSLTRWEVRR